MRRVALSRLSWFPVPALVLALAGCADATPVALAEAPAADPPSASAARAADRCENVVAEGSASLVLVQVSPGVFAVGTFPTPTTLAGVDGLLSSVVTGMSASGTKEQGAQHLTLTHTFTSPQGSFTTSDRAVCSPAGKDARTCRVSDVLSVVSGTGVFANAGGSLRNHGVIDLNTFSLSISLRGRLCGDGL